MLPPNRAPFTLGRAAASAGAVPPVAEAATVEESLVSASFRKVSDAGIDLTTRIRVVEVDAAGAMQLSSMTAKGEITVLTNFAAEGDTLTLTQLHIDGPGAALWA